MTIFLRIGARAVASLAQAITLFLVAKAEGVESFGLLGAGLALGYLLNALFGFGTAGRVLRLGAELDGERLALGFLRLRLLGCLLCGVVLYLALWPWTSFAIASVVVSVSLADFLVEYVQSEAAGRGRIGTSSLMLLSHRLIVLLTIVTSYSISFSLWWYAAGSLAAALLIAGKRVCVAVVSARCSASSPVETIRGSLGFWAAALAATVKQAEPLAAGVGAGSGAAAGFTISSRMVNPLLIATAAAQTVFVVDLANAETEAVAKATKKKLFSFFGAYALLLLVAAAPLGNGLVALLGEGFSQWRTLIVATVASCGLSSLSQAVQTILLAEGNAGVSAKVIGGWTLAGLPIIALSADSGLVWVVPVFIQGGLCLNMFWALYQRNRLTGG